MKSVVLLFIIILAVSSGVIYFGLYAGFDLDELTPATPEAHASVSQTTQNGTTYIEATLTEADNVDRVVLLDNTGDPVTTADGEPAVFTNPTNQIGQTLLIPRSAINGSRVWVRAEHGEQSKIVQQISLENL